ncbi:prolipoprotein diacylglyceryl transferase [Galbitalea soli]|uniref:Phosphatidylglycerol--prolipoprotein diacylglyceryl transferase n=1 Tax=Galbitalea soli TaxID=1268042 RepID=A0A7C9PL30_9MICO|nr:prolipoprotein diacylglyceryl transferase [Galbitalea soli]NEM89789.1 prolipoprotein diacylglyceryl transferase [Galbitalea soli]NYJ30493.1 prolipoprotein diacylglyceryl transferase [Galbitalea soli]
MLHASIPSPPSAWAQFSIGPLTIHTYAICILIGMVAAIIITQSRLTRRGAPSGVVLDIVFWAIPLGIVGARFYHVFTHVGDYFFPGANLWNVFAIWDGGNALYGSLIGGAIGAWIGCRRYGIRYWAFADALAPAMLVAQSLGRFGNYFNHELFGLPTTLPWGLQIESTNAKFPAGLPAGTLFHPLFLYEIIWNLIGVAILLLIERRLHPQWGKLFGAYLIWYGLGRSWLEAIRIDPTSDGYLGIPANIWASFVAIALGILLIVVQSRRHPGVEPSVFVDGWVPKNAAATVDTYSDSDEEPATTPSETARTP